MEQYEFLIWLFLPLFLLSLDVSLHISFSGSSWSLFTYLQQFLFFTTSPLCSIISLSPSVSADLQNLSVFTLVTTQCYSKMYYNYIGQQPFMFLLRET